MRRFLEARVGVLLFVCSNVRWNSKVHCLSAGVQMVLTPQIGTHLMTPVGLRAILGDLVESVLSLTGYIFAI